MAAQLGSVDIILIVISMVLTALIGLYFTNKNKSLDAYLLADRRLSVLPVAISLMTSCMSGLTLMGSSAELFYQGPSYAFIALAIALSGPITAYTILPVFYKMNELSLNTYLKKRYGPVIKYLMTTIFIFQMIFYNSVVIYLPSMALSSIFQVDNFYSILIIGSMCVLYSGIGGMKAVVWTDLFQAFLMYASVIFIAVLGTVDAGGFKQVFRIASDGNRLDLNQFLNVDLTTRHTLWAILIGSTLKFVYAVGVNQVQIQRSLSLPSLRQAQIAFILCSLFAALISLLSTYLGFVLFAAYRSCDPYLAGEIPRRDAIIMHYVTHRFADLPGVRGLFIAGIFSATLSTLSSFSNSMAALAIEDFIKPALVEYKPSWATIFDDKTGNNKSATRLAKILATCFGLIGVLMAYLVDRTSSRLLQMNSTMTAAIGVPFLAVFALGIFTQFTNTKGILTGLLLTLTLGGYITIQQSFFGPPLEPTMPVYYDHDQCAKVFNQTLNPNELPEIGDVFGYAVEFPLPPSHQQFAINRISYISLPAIQFVLTIIISSLVSLLTGGWNQQVADECLVKSIQSASTNQRSVHRLSGDKLASGIDSIAHRKRKIGIVNRVFEDEGM